MRTDRLVWIGWVAVLAVGCAGEAPTPAPAVMGPENPNFDTDVAVQLIQSSPDFGAGDSRITVLERNMMAGEEQGLWSFNRRRTDDGYRRVDVELSPEARTWIESAEYNVGGIIRLLLTDPLTRSIVEVDEVTDAEWPLMKEVRFHWKYDPVPDSMAQLKPELIGGPYRGVARLQYQIDTWRIVGTVRDFQIPL